MSETGARRRTPWHLILGGPAWRALKTSRLSLRGRQARFRAFRRPIKEIGTRHHRFIATVEFSERPVIIRELTVVKRGQLHRSSLPFNYPIVPIHTPYVVSWRTRIAARSLSELIAQSD